MCLLLITGGYSNQNSLIGDELTIKVTQFDKIDDFVTKDLIFKNFFRKPC